MASRPGWLPRRELLRFEFRCYGCSLVLRHCRVNDVGAVLVERHLAGELDQAGFICGGCIADELHKRTPLLFPPNPIRSRIQRQFRTRIARWATAPKIPFSMRALGLCAHDLAIELGAPPGLLQDFEIDHLTPLSQFDFTRSGQLQLAWSPENLQWLTPLENRQKGAQ